MRLTMLSVCLGLLCFYSSNSPGQEKPKPTADDETSEQRLQRFTEQMSQVKLVGRFTVIGQDDGPLTKEEYTIHKVEKVPEGDKWLFHCRIKYGQHDLAIPLPLDVKWAGDTPIITLNDLTIPGLGTFSSRVVLHDNKYAGTWRHDKVGGHLFGVIEKLEEADKDSSGEPKKD